MLFLLLYGLHFRKMSIHLTVKQKVNSTFIQSWECGVARKVLKCTKHLYISMCICVTKERLLKASLSSWCHYNQAYFLRTDASIENTKDQLRVLAVQMSYFLTSRPERSYSEKCFNNFSYGLHCFTHEFCYKWGLWGKKKLYHKLILIFLSAIRVKQCL